MSNRHKTVNSNLNFPSGDENQDNINQAEISIESTHDQTSVETNTNPTEIKQQNPLIFSDPFYSDSR